MYCQQQRVKLKPNMNKKHQDFPTFLRMFEARDFAQLEKFLLAGDERKSDLFSMTGYVSLGDQPEIM